jgi:hypothetical protein
MDFEEIGWGGMDWIDLTKNIEQLKALVNTVVNLRVAQNTGKSVSSCTTGDLSRKSKLHGEADILIDMLSNIIPLILL